MLNKHNLPEYLINSVYAPFKPNPYRYGITALIDPPLIKTLKAKHWDELEEDIADHLWMIHGTALDKMIKKNSVYGLTNIKLEMVWTKDKDGNEITVVAKPDYYGVLTKVLADFKDTSVWTVINGKPEWDDQLNCYDYMLSYVLKDQLPVDKLQVHAFCKDWKKNEKLRSGADYPSIPMSIIDIPKWGRAEQRAFIDNRLQDHLQNPTRKCTAEEQWAKPAVYAVKKLGNKTAKGGKLCASQTEADRWIVAHPEKKWEVEFRPAECPRCSNYCSVNKFCKYYKEN